ncbi:MAG: DUF4920 domain-containing protein [Bacteroidota bacterium]
MKKLILMFLATSVMIACQESTKTENTETPKEETAEAATNTFGEAITAESAISFEELVQKMESTDSMLVKVKGTVESVCQAKGCWMNIVSSETEEEMFVKFKDYGFFMPKDIAGQEVIMEGYAYREVTPIEELRHYAEDAGKSEEEIAAITEPEEEFKFMASGVILLEDKGM